jgi:type I restriction enzyme S subunit
MVPAGALLLAMYGANVGRLGTLGVPATTNQAVCHIIPDPTVAEVRYLFHAMCNQASTLIARSVGGAQPNISQGIVKDLTLPLPPLPEQRRIAEILDKADALRAQRRAALAQLDALSQSIFIDMFGDPATNPKGWPIAEFGQVCETRLGKMLDKKRQTGEHRRPYLRNANVQWFRFDLKSLLDMDFGEDERRVLRLEPGDLLICEGGEPGRAAVWQGELEECYFQKALHRARPDPSIASPVYLAWLLWFHVHTGKLSGVTSATIAHLTGEKLAILPTMLPPPSLQREFEKRLGRLESVARQHRAALSNLDALFTSLQYRAFRGELFSSDDRSVPEDQNESLTTC